MEKSIHMEGTAVMNQIEENADEEGDRRIRKDLLVLGVSGTLPGLYALSSLCVPAMEDKERRHASFDRSINRQQNEDKVYAICGNNENLINDYPCNEFEAD